MIEISKNLLSARKRAIQSELVSLKENNLDDEQMVMVAKLIGECLDSLVRSARLHDFVMESCEVRWVNVPIEDPDTGEILNKDMDEGFFRLVATAHRL